MAADGGQPGVDQASMLCEWRRGGERVARAAQMQAPRDGNKRRSTVPPPFAHRLMQSSDPTTESICRKGRNCGPLRCLRPCRRPWLVRRTRGEHTRDGAAVLDKWTKELLGGLKPIGATWAQCCSCHAASGTASGKRVCGRLACHAHMGMHGRAKVRRAGSRAARAGRQGLIPGCLGGEPCAASLSKPSTARCKAEGPFGRLPSH